MLVIEHFLFFLVIFFHTSAISIENKIILKDIAGVEKRISGETIEYIETSEINITPPIEKIQSEIIGEGINLPYPSGGALKFDVSISHENDYPFENNIKDDESVELKINCNIFDLENCENKNIQFEKNNNKHVTKKTKIKDGKITFDESGENRLYTKMKLNKGKYNIEIKIKDLGQNNNT